MQSRSIKKHCSFLILCTLKPKFHTVTIYINMQERAIRIVLISVNP